MLNSTLSYFSGKNSFKKYLGGSLRFSNCGRGVEKGAKLSSIVTNFDLKPVNK